MPAFYSNSSKQTFQVKLLERCFWKLPQYFCIWYSYNKVAMGFYGFEIFFSGKNGSSFTLKGSQSDWGHTEELWSIVKLEDICLQWNLATRKLGGQDLGANAPVSLYRICENTIQDLVFLFRACKGFLRYTMTRTLSWPDGSFFFNLCGCQRRKSLGQTNKRSTLLGFREQAGFPFGEKKKCYRS